jgi:ribonuclease P protein component
MVAEFPREDGEKASPRRPEGLPRSRRLRRRAEYQAIYASGRKVFGRFVVVFAAPAPSSGRLGVTASKRIGDATERNRAKRRIREIVRRGEPLPFDVVVNVREGAARAPFDELRRDVRRALGRLLGAA